MSRKHNIPITSSSTVRDEVVFKLGSCKCDDVNSSILYDTYE